MGKFLTYRNAFTQTLFIWSIWVIWWSSMGMLYSPIVCLAFLFGAPHVLGLIIFRVSSGLYFKCCDEGMQKAFFIFSVSDFKESWRLGEPLWLSLIRRACDRLQLYSTNYDFRYLIQHPFPTMRCKAVNWHEPLFNPLVEGIFCLQYLRRQLVSILTVNGLFSCLISRMSLLSAQPFF